jgi:hypothetical protein
MGWAAVLGGSVLAEERFLGMVYRRTYQGHSTSSFLPLLKQPNPTQPNSQRPQAWPVCQAAARRPPARPLRMLLLVAATVATASGLAVVWQAATASLVRHSAWLAWHFLATPFSPFQSPPSQGMGWLPCRYGVTEYLAQCERVWSA